MKSWGLGIYTGSDWLGLGLAENQGRYRLGSWLEGRKLSESLLPHLKEFIAPQTWDQLAWISMIAGPGSFTSIRLGVVAARTLGQALEIPVFSQSALAAAAYGVARPLAVAMPAHGDQVYGALYGIEPESSGQIWAKDLWLAASHPYPRLWIADLPATRIVEALLLDSWARYQRGERPEWSQAVPVYLQPFPGS